jgi:hypothetical protein
MNLAALRRAVRNRIGSPTSDDFFTDDVLTDVINLAINQIEEQQMWPWTERLDAPVLAPGVTTVTLQPDWRATRSIVLTAPNTWELDNVAAADIMRYRTNTTGPPRVFAEIGGGIQVRPIPDSTYPLSHLYYSQTPQLVNNADVPLMPDRFAGAIVTTATLILSEREGNKAMSQLYSADQTNWVNLMRRAVRRTTGPVTPRVRPGSWLGS